MLLTNEAHGALIHSFMVVMIAAEKQAFFLCAKKKKSLGYDLTLKQGFLMV